MKFNYKSRIFNLIDYSEEKHGKIPVHPTKYDSDLQKLSIEEQLDRFYIYFGKVNDDDYGTERYERLMNYAKKIEYQSSQYSIDDVIVDKGVVVGFSIISYSTRCGVLFLHKPLYLYETEDNNGAGYKSAYVYISLMIG